MSEKHETPRTDAKVKKLISYGADFTHPANVMTRHAEDLERELAEVTAQRDEARQRSFDKTHALVSDIEGARYGQPITAALHLCLDLEEDAKSAKRQLAAAESALQSLRDEVGGLREALVEVDGCFEAAYIEGLADALAEQPTHNLSLGSLVRRRLLPARDAAVAALTTQGPTT